MFPLPVLLAAQVSSLTLAPYDRLTPQVAAERVSRCGAGPVTVRTDKETNVELLVVAAKRAITDEQIACIAKAASFYDVELPPDAQRRLNVLTEARSAVIVEAEGKKWLLAHNLLGKLPEYKAGSTDDDKFARQVEELCGASGALHSVYGVHTLNPEWAMQQQETPNEDGPFVCVISTVFASGFEIEFIGNAQGTP